MRRNRQLDPEHTRRKVKPRVRLPLSTRGERIHAPKVAYKRRPKYPEELDVESM